MTRSDRSRCSPSTPMLSFMTSGAGSRASAPRPARSGCWRSKASRPGAALAAPSSTAARRRPSALSTRAARRAEGGQCGAQGVRPRALISLLTTGASSRQRRGAAHRGGGLQAAFCDGAHQQLHRPRLRLRELRHPWPREDEDPYRARADSGAGPRIKCGPATQSGGAPWSVRCRCATPADPSSAFQHRRSAGPTAGKPRPPL